MKTRIAGVLGLLACAGMALAQDQGAPRATATGTVGAAKVSVDYGRPALKGRALADLTKDLPEDRIWRAGENEVTILTTSADILVGGKKVPAGRYSVYVHIPATGDWSLVLNKDQGIALGKIWSKAPAAAAEKPWPRLDGYTKNIADQEVARVAMKPGTVPSPVDIFAIGIAPVREGATLTMSWGDKSYSVELKPSR